MNFSAYITNPEKYILLSFLVFTVWVENFENKRYTIFVCVVFNCKTLSFTNETTGRNVNLARFYDLLAPVCGINLL